MSKSKRILTRGNFSTSRKIKAQIEREEKRHTHVVTETSETSLEEMYRVQASERSARSQIKTLTTELKKQKEKVSDLISDATARAKRFDQDMKKSIHTERERVEKLRVATESISEAVVAMFAALLAGNARLHKGLRREDDQQEKKDKEDDEDAWSLRERHQEILRAVQDAVDRRPPDELTLQVLLAETVQERVRVQSARDVVSHESVAEEEDNVASVIRRYEELIELRERERERPIECARVKSTRN